MPAIKNFTDIRFFLKTPETTAAFVTTPFTGSFSGVNQYPNQDFDNITPINLNTLSNNYEIFTPTSLGNINSASTTSKTISSALEIFGDVQNGDYILYRETTEDIGDLKLLGIVDSVGLDGDSLTLYKNSPISVTAFSVKTVYRFPKSSVSIGFPINANFYMVVKNADYDDDGNYNGVLNIDTTVTTPTSNVFAYGPNRTANPTYFKLQRISKVNVGDEPDTVEDLTCTVKGVSTYSETSLFPLTELNADKFPIWSVYEVNPFGNTSNQFNKNTFYRVDIPLEEMPAQKFPIATEGGGGGEPAL